MLPDRRTHDHGVKPFLDRLIAAVRLSGGPGRQSARPQPVVGLNLFFVGYDHIADCHLAAIDRRNAMGGPPGFHPRSPAVVAWQHSGRRSQESAIFACPLSSADRNTDRFPGSLTAS